MNDINFVFYVYDDLNRFLDGFVLKMNFVPEVKRTDVVEIKHYKPPKQFFSVLKVDGYFLSVFSQLIKMSEFHSKMLALNLFKSLKSLPSKSYVNIKFELVKPKSEFLDYWWNDKISHLIFQRQELEHTMSWLSTLGGAFSALGDKFENHAKVAGKISIQQFKIAYQLGEPLLVARCRLYMALSLIQLGNLTTAKKLIESQFKLAKNFKDTRLQNMCKGMWAKLQYAYSQRRTILYNKEN